MQTLKRIWKWRYIFVAKKQKYNHS
jgi:hypothetical protein